MATATRGLRVQGGSGADGFDDLITELAENDTAVHRWFALWRNARKAMLELQFPAARAHDFAALTCELFLRAAWVRIAALSDDPTIVKLRDNVMSRAIPGCFE